TDIAARGIDIDGVSHVINYELPNIPETYVHRIGRTARAGAEGKSFSFCDQEEREFLRDIERLIRQKIRVETDNPFAAGVYVPTKPEKTEAARPPREQQGRRDSRGGGGGRSQGRSGPRPEGRSGPRPESREARPESNRPDNRSDRGAPRPSAFAGNARTSPARPDSDRNREARPQNSQQSDTRRPSSSSRPQSRDGRSEQPRSGGPSRASSASASSSGPAASGNRSRSRGGRGRGRGTGTRSEGSTSSSSSSRSESGDTGGSEKKSWWKRLTGTKE
ncbi:MAG: helicase-related protein, partial [Bdellovibrionota bacterium]